MDDLMEQKLKKVIIMTHMKLDDAMEPKLGLTQLGQVLHAFETSLASQGLEIARKRPEGKQP